MKFNHRHSLLGIEFLRKTGSTVKAVREVQEHHRARDIQQTPSSSIVLVGWGGDRLSVTVVFFLKEPL